MPSRNGRRRRDSRRHRTATAQTGRRPEAPCQREGSSPARERTSRVGEIRVHGIPHCRQARCGSTDSSLDLRLPAGLGRIRRHVPVKVRRGVLLMVLCGAGCTQYPRTSTYCEPPAADDGFQPLAGFECADGSIRSTAESCRAAVADTRGSFRARSRELPPGQIRCPSHILDQWTLLATRAASGATMWTRCGRVSSLFSKRIYFELTRPSRLRSCNLISMVSMRSSFRSR
jgi:hypothetical protein